LHRSRGFGVRPWALSEFVGPNAARTVKCPKVRKTIG
jgi:hypothetical protein